LPSASLSPKYLKNLRVVFSLSHALGKKWLKKFVAKKKSRIVGGEDRHQGGEEGVGGRKRKSKGPHPKNEGGNLEEGGILIHKIILDAKASTGRKVLPQGPTRTSKQKPRTPF